MFVSHWVPLLNLTIFYHLRSSWLSLYHRFSYTESNITKLYAAYLRIWPSCLVPIMNLNHCYCLVNQKHYNDVIMGARASQITSLTIVYSAVYSDADQRKHQSSLSLVFLWGPVNSPRKWPVTRKMFPFDDVIMAWNINKFSSVFSLQKCYQQCDIYQWTRYAGSLCKDIWGMPRCPFY